LRQTDSLTSGPGGSSHSEGSSLRGFLGLVRRRKWVILLPTVLVPTLVLLLSLAQTPKYEAKSQVYIHPTDVAVILGKAPDPSQYEPPDRRAQTNALLARVPAVARDALYRANVGGLTPQQFLDSSSASAAANADILDLAVTVRDRQAAARLASAYATAYKSYRQELDTSALSKAGAQVQQKMDRLAAEGLQHTRTYAALAANEQQLQTLETLETSNTSVVRSPTSATQVSPRPLRNTFLGLILGLILGIALAVLWEKIDTRVRTSDEVEDRLGLPILARLPAPSRELAAADKLVMLHEPSGSVADHYRLLRARVELANLDLRAKTVMVSSAYEQEGKSTTAANLALALARAGKRVILVDLDLRNPSLHKYFDLDGRSGVTDLALGATDIRNAGGRVAIPSPGENAEPRDMNGHSPVAGFLRVIPTGPTPADGSTSEFITSAALSTLLEELSADADVLLIDAPPLLVGGDAIALSTKVDAILVVTRLSAVRRPALAELRRVLSDCPAYELGLIVTGAEDASVAGYYSARRRVAAAPASRPRVRARDS
jgi:non-specific protein-tyrosine kinase